MAVYLGDYNQTFELANRKYLTKQYVQAAELYGLAYSQLNDKDSMRTAIVSGYNNSIEGAKNIYSDDSNLDLPVKISDFTLPQTNEVKLILEKGDLNLKEILPEKKW